MTSIVRQITNRTDNLQAQIKVLKEQHTKGAVDMEEIALQFKREKQANAKLQVEYDKLE
jgi:hypothetical protein